MNELMNKTIIEAKLAVKKNHGGPFGAIVVRNGKVIASAHNTVIKTNDPTNHAEMNAIRIAAKKLKKFDLSDCELYTSCEPCPMCFSAIHWAKIKKVYFGCTKDDAAKIGFDDKFIYDVLKGTSKKKKVHLKMNSRKECLEAFEDWKNKSNKKMY